MADTVTPERRSEIMSRIKSKGTKPEMRVRRLVHSLGFRYRLHKHKLPGRPDLVFGPRKKVIFVHGCFWHMHPDPECKLATLPKSNTDYWLPKLKRNLERDNANREALKELGWEVLTIWECEIRKSVDLERRIVEFLKAD